MMSAERVEIRPNVVRNAAWATLGCAAFTGTGAWMAVGSDNLLGRFAGALAVMFFGTGLALIPMMLRRTVPLVLTPDALEQVYPQGTATIPWADVAFVGLLPIGAARPLVGIRLTSCDRYLESMSPGLAAHAERGSQFLKVVAGAAAVLSLGSARMLVEYCRAHDTADRLAWQRKWFGYDIALAWNEMDRPARDFAALLNAHVARYRSQLNPGA